MIIISVFFSLISTGQVHRARLKGQEVVIKVQRPGLKDLFDIDLKNLRVSVSTIIQYRVILCCLSRDFSSGLLKLLYDVLLSYWLCYASI